jgi:VanZ family protein
MFAKADPDLKLRSFWLSVAYGLVVLVIYLSLTSDPVKINLSLLYQDKFFHALAYFVLMSWFAQIYHTNIKRNIIAIILIAVGVSLEFLQSMSPVRFFEYADMLANSTGVALGYFLTLTSAKNCLLKFEKLVLGS